MVWNLPLSQIRTLPFLVLMLPVQTMHFTTAR